MINYKNHLILTKTPIREALSQLTILGIDAIIFVIDKNEKLLRDLGETMVNGSLCAMGGMTPFPVISALNFFPKDFGL